MHVEAQWSCAVAVCDKYWFCVLRVSVYLDLPLENMVHCAIWSKYIKMTLFLSSVFSFSHEQSWLWIMHSLKKKKKRWTIREECDTYSLTHLFRCSQEDMGSQWANITWENLSGNWLSLCLTSPEGSTSFSCVPP